LSIYIRIRVPNFPSTTAWDHTSDPQLQVGHVPKWYTGGRLHTYWICCNPHRSSFVYEILKAMSDHLYILELVLLYTSRQTVFTEILKPKRNCN
jgi:hypothetical protein